MKVTVKDCLSLEALSSGTLVAGKKNLGSRVRWVSVMDGADPKVCVEENGIAGQLVLTKFRGVVSGRTKAEIVSALGKTSISALVILNQPGGSNSLEHEVIQAAEKTGLPLIVTSEENPVEYADVLDQIIGGLIYGDSFNNGLINNTIYHLLDFEKHSNFQSALKSAAINNDFQVILLSPDFNPIVTVETRQKANLEEAIRMGREKNLTDSPVYTLIDVNGVLTYWGPIMIGDETYFLLLVDNEDSYSAGDITKLAEIIELAIGMWKYTPQRDVKADFIKALVRSNKSLAYSIKDEMEVSGDSIVSVFYATGLDKVKSNEVIGDFEQGYDAQIIWLWDELETYGIILDKKEKTLELDASEEEVSLKSAAIDFYARLKEISKSVRIFHGTGIDGLEGAADAFRLIGETWTYVEYVFPYKRVFTKYDMTLVSTCINLQVQGGYLKKNYQELLEPFSRELGENKAKQLLDTLETFVLDAGMNSGKTSKIMGIHANTVKYRLKRINEVLGTDVTGNRVIPGLTMALGLKRLEDVTKQ